MMGWRVSSAMEEKLRFVYEYERDEQSMKDLCVVFGISRRLGMCGCVVTGSMLCGH
jgi:hypothetical protein